MPTRRHVTGLLGALALMVGMAQAVPQSAGPVRPASNAPVADAAMRGETDTVRTLLRGGADVNAAQGDGMTALHWTALNGDTETMDILLYAGASMASLTRLGSYTPLHLASVNGHGPAVTRLLTAGSKPDPVTGTGVQPLHLAAQSGSAEAVKALLDHGAEVNAKDETHGRTPLIFAASRDRLEAMQVLLAEGADITAATNIVDYIERAAQDGAARSARSRAASGRGGGRGQASLFAGRAGAAPAAARGRGGRAGGRGSAQPDPVDPDDPPGTPRAGQPTATARSLSSTEQIGRQGGFTALHYAARDGFVDAALLMVEAGLDINVETGGDKSSPMLVAIINGNFDLAAELLARGADPNLTSDDSASPLFAVLNNEWALRTWYPQPTASKQQKTSYLDLMEDLLEAGADPNARTTTHIWYAAYNAGRMGVDFSGATPFWRAAYALDVEAMRLLTTWGGDPNITTMKMGSSRNFGGSAFVGAGLQPPSAAPTPRTDPSGLAPVPPGGPHVPPFHAASGVGYGTSRVAQQHRHVPEGWMPAAKYFIEELSMDINMRDADGFTALHHAAARGDNEMILYLVDKGADVMVVNRRGQTTVDMANSPEQRTQPFPETIKLLEGMGAKNNHNCRACD